jgi:hypothetical protein
MANALARWYNGLGESRVDATPEVLDEKLMRRLQALGYLD